MSEVDNEMSSPGDLAREILHTGAVAERYNGTTASDTVVLAEYQQRQANDGYGGWPEYTTADLLSEQPLKEMQYAGRRIDSMRRQELDIGGCSQAAFVTDYSQEEPRMRQAHSQMAVWAFCDALGLDVPRHHWLPEEEVVVVEEVGRLDEPIQDPISVAKEAAEQVNAEPLQDYISVQLIAGTEDLRPVNFKIGPRGDVYVFDFDKSDQRYANTRVLHHACNKAMQTVDVLNQTRDDELAITRNSICSQVEQIATTLHASSHLDRILDTVELYDTVFTESTNKEFEERFRNNITVLSELED